MKKYSCNCNKNTSGVSCHQCGESIETRSVGRDDANLYAAEFFLYAFHFENEPRRTESSKKFASSLTMMVVEG